MIDSCLAQSAAANPAAPAPLPGPLVHSRDILQTAHPLAWAPLWLLSRSASSVRTEGKNVFSWALAASAGWSLLPAGSRAKLGEPSTPWKQGPRILALVLPPPHAHQCDFKSVPPLSLWASVSQHAKLPPSPMYLPALMIWEFYRVSDSGPEWSSKTTSRVDTLGKEISEGSLEAGA